MSNVKVLITTGIYPPKIGGPAQYAKNLKIALEKAGAFVDIKTFNFEDYLPTGIRHIFFFFKILLNVLTSDFVIALDTFSVGLPSVLLGKIFGKEVIVRTGGDFLWEQYVERTGKKVLFRNFYAKEKDKFNQKERLIFKLTRWALQNASKVVFSTEWQRNIFIQAYGLNIINVSVIENFYGPKEGLPAQAGDFESDSKVFVASTRNLRWKNIDVLKNIFNKVDTKIPEGVSLFTDSLEFDEFMEKVKKSYAVIVVSLGDISPNIILDAIRHNKPFICTKENGIFDRIKDIGLFVDPLNEADIENAIIKLLDKTEYDKYCEKVKNFNFSHAWEDIANEFLEIYNSMK